MHTIIKNTNKIYYELIALSRIMLLVKFLKKFIYIKTKTQEH